MKTTIDLPENLVRRAKVQAAETGTTLKELVVKGLAMVTGEESVNKEEARRDRIKKMLSEFRFENTESIEPLSREECHDR